MIRISFRFDGVGGYYGGVLWSGVELVGVVWDRILLVAWDEVGRDEMYGRGD